MKTWFITGASSGLGKEMATIALENGDQVVASARNPAALADLLQAYPKRVATLALDVTDFPQIEPTLAAAWECFGRVDVLVNNAGYGLVAALEETDDERMNRNLATNLTGPLHLMRAAIPRMRAQGGGHLISITAIAAFSNEPGFSVYGAAKAGLEAASSALVGELEPFGIKVSIVSPGPVRTEFISRSLDTVPRHPEYANTVGKFDALLQRINGRQTGDPRKAAEAIYQIAHSASPPFRLVLGKYAYDKFAKQLKSLAAELDQWKAVGLPTDFSA